MFVVLLRYTAPLAAIDAHIEEHRRFLDRHFEGGHLIASGAKVPRDGGVILAHNLSRAALETLLEEDPFKRERLADYEIIEFSARKVAPGLEALLQA